MTLEELKAQYPDAEVVNFSENNCVSAVYDYLEECFFDPCEISENGVILVVDPHIAYYVSTPTLEAACFEPNDVEDWLFEQHVVDAETIFYTLDDAGMTKFWDTASALGFETAVEDVPDYATGSFDAFDTPYGSCFDAVSTFWYTVMADRVKSEAIEYELD